MTLTPLEIALDIPTTLKATSFNHEMKKKVSNTLINDKICDHLKPLIPKALTLSTQRLQEGLTIISGGRFSDLDEYFGDTTVDKTKLLANVFNPALEDAAKECGVDYISEETVGYDAKCVGEEIENKLTLTKSTCSFATGNNHSKTKVDKIFCVKATQVGNIFPSVFACIVDLSTATHPDTGWDDKVTETGKNNNGFSTLRVHNDDLHCITVIYGKVRQTQKYIHTVYETLSE